MPAYPRPHAMVQHLLETAEDFFLYSVDTGIGPLRIRPAIVVALAAWLVLLGILGLAPLPELSLNDKALHFFGMGFAAFLFYFVIDVPEGPHRRVWYIRRAPLLLTLVCVFLIGGVVSEFVQALLPYKTFQFLDIVANLFGASVFTYIAHLLAKRARKRAEIGELYQPLSLHQGQVYRDAQGRTHQFGGAAAGAGAGAAAAAAAAEYDLDENEDNVWDDGMEDVQPVFALDDEVV